MEQKDFSNKIIFIENADPGYDWLFGLGISGLVTKYGGANSHMAIRCAEFSLPFNWCRRGLLYILSNR